MVANGSSSRHRRSSSSTTPSSSTKRRTSSTTHEKKKVTKPMGICSFCLGDEEKNGKGVPEDMISCSECGNCGHPSCLKYSDKLVEKIKTIRWQCLDCKKCYVCNIGDDSLLFCDVCDAAIHPKCCTPPLNHIPKGVFTCPNCRHEKTIKSTRSLRNKTSSDEETPTVITRPVAQLIDGMSNFFLPKKDKNNKNNNQRQQSVQKAMKYLRNKTSKSPTRTNQLLARTILTSSKTSRIKRKPAILTDESSPNSQQTIKRRSTAKTSPVPTPVRSNEKSSPVIPKRKQSSSPVSSHTPVTIKKRSKTDSIIKKTPSKRKENKKEQEDESDNDEEKNKQQKISTVNKRKLNLDLSKYKTPPSFLNDALPDTINTTDVYLFLDARKNSSKLISDASDKFHHTTEPIEEDANNPRWPPYIVFGDELIKTWYSSSYPQEYARVPCLFICEFCLKYMKCEQVYDRHRKKCQTFHPPANEIYHKDDLSVFEVDGNINRIYCQNLCLLAKLFLDHKTLYYDVEPFLFYVLTKNDSNGCHFLGYFSKEKHCPQKYNLSCITVLPHCQRRGYGRLLIELSYLLSQKEGQIGTPERPLSTHGAQTYEAYWQIRIVEQLLKYYRSRKEKCTLKELMNETGITIDDIIDTLQNLGVLTMQSNEKPVIHADITQLENIMNTEKLKHAHWISLDGEFLRFTPVLKPILFLTDGNSNENQPEQIEIVFKKIIESDTSDSTKNPIESGDGSTNNPESVRYIRRRKFGRKRRSIYVKCRVSNKTESNATTHEDEHSQEYIARRQDESSVDESTKDGEDDSEQIPSPVNPISNQPKFKQLTLDQFLKKIPVNKEKKEEQEEPIPEVKTEEEVVPKRTKRLSSSHVSKSETDLSKIANGTIEDIVKKPLVSHHRLLVRQTSDGTMSSNDSSPSPLPFKKRAWTSSNIQALIDPPINPKKSDHPVLSRETSIATPSSVSDTSANPLMTSSSSVNSTTTDDETKIARIESQLKTTIQPVEDNDDQPPSLTSPTSMIVSQSNHYNYPTRSSVAKQQQQQSITINNFNTSTNMTYNYGQTSYPYPYPPGPPPPTMDMQSFYYSPPMSMNYMPYYPTSTSPMYPSGQPLCYQPNGTYPNNSSPSYNYSTSQSSSSSSSSNRRH